MLLVYDSGNDDETVFPEPRKFDIDRPNLGRHVGFGGGPHRCIGLALARMEIKLAARRSPRQMKNIKLAIPERSITYLPTVATRTIASLPITYEKTLGARRTLAQELAARSRSSPAGPAASAAPRPSCSSPRARRW